MSYSLMSVSNGVCFSSVLLFFSMSSLSLVVAGTSTVVGTLKSTGSESNSTADILIKYLTIILLKKQYLVYATFSLLSLL